MFSEISGFERRSRDYVTKRRIDRSIPLSEGNPELAWTIMMSFPELEDFFHHLDTAQRLISEALGEVGRRDPRNSGRFWIALEELGSLEDKADDLKTVILGFLITGCSSSRILLDLKASLLEVVEEVEGISSILGEEFPKVRETVRRVRLLGEAIKLRAETLYRTISPESSSLPH